MWEDPIVEEVRKVRKAHAARFNYDLRAIYRDVKEQERKSGKVFVSYPPRRIQHAVQTGTAQEGITLAEQNTPADPKSARKF